VSQIKNLKTDLSQVDAAGEDFARRFYNHLFKIDPSLKDYFEGVDMSSQGAMVLQAVRIAINGLENPEVVRPTLESLGKRHVSYGVVSDHYSVAVEAFVRALKETLGASFTAKKERVWKDMLSTITSVMIEGAENEGRRLATKQAFGIDGDAKLRTDPYVARFMIDDLDAYRDLYADAKAQDLPASISIEYVGEKVAVAAPLQTILDVSLKNEIPHICVCGALGKCSTCRVVVLEGLDQCLPRNQAEQRMASIKGFSPEVRLACQTRVVGPVKVKRLVHDNEDVREAADVGRDYVGREAKLAVLFADIKGFTSFTEDNLAYDIVHALNRYFNAVGKAIDSHGGYIDKYIGDGIMALFGLTTDRTTHPCVDAVNAAVEMMQNLTKVNAYLGSHLEHQFHIGVGIHYGSVVVGELGYQERRQFTAIGDVVNTAARLEAAAKLNEATILISDAVSKNLPKDTIPLGRTLDLKLKGKRSQQIAHEIILP
jgi:class 3 adenylate cyclase/hemoglobin-like flavoprotein